VILTAGGGAFGHKDGPKQGAISRAQGEELWKLWKAGTYGDVSLADGVIEYAKTHEALKGAPLPLPHGHHELRQDECDAYGMNIAFMLQDDVAGGSYFTQDWDGMKQATPLISCGIDALRLPASSRTWATPS
jgi:ribulose 1,5-bisphosphate carboxylase large subunit-like protein